MQATTRQRSRAIESFTSAKTAPAALSFPLVAAREASRVVV